MLIKQLKKRIRKHGLELFEQDILARALPTVILQPKASKKLPVGVSKIGGIPDLGPGQNWPFSNAKAMTFVAQINFSELKKSSICAAVPDEGLLSLFYDTTQNVKGLEPGDNEYWQVLFYDDEFSLLSNDQLPLDDAVVLRQFRLLAQDSLSLPYDDESLFDKFGEIEDLNEEDDNSDDSYEDLYYGLYEEIVESERHKVFGYPDEVGVEITHVCELVSSGQSASSFTRKQLLDYEAAVANEKSWCLLLQLASDQRLNMNWGDSDRLYLWIKAEDLAAKRFNNAWLIVHG